MSGKPKLYSAEYWRDRAEQAELERDEAREAWHDMRGERDGAYAALRDVQASADRKHAQLAAVPTLVEALRDYHACAPAAGQALEELGYALIASDFHRANQAAEDALAKFEQAQGEKP